ncbi:MAG TPA: hypothetical protein VMP08_06030 [Anaerolineae bacterium]|nr:hypothetical protein [Anaerolineae bacterium]
MSNNTAMAQVVLTNPRFEVAKSQAGSGIAGTVITNIESHPVIGTSLQPPG